MTSFWQARLLSVLPWLKLVGGLLAFLLLSLYTAVHSQLGSHISTGESPAFAWARTHLPSLLLVGLAYLLALVGIQYLCLRWGPLQRYRTTALLTGSELGALAALAVAVSEGATDIVPPAHFFLQLSLVLQALLTLWRSGPGQSSHLADLLDRGGKNPLPFLGLLFLMAALPAALDPSWRRLQAHARLDSTIELLLAHSLPPLLSGVTALWLGMGILALLQGMQALWKRLDRGSPWRVGVSLLPFFSIAGVCAAVFLASLIQGIEWELNTLHLRGAILPLFILLCGAGGALTFASFHRIASYAPRPRVTGLMEMMGASLGAALVFPVTRLLARPGGNLRSWRSLLGVGFLGASSISAYILYGGLFDPWFTAFSHLKATLLKITALVSASCLSLLAEELLPGWRSASMGRSPWAVMTVMGFAGFIPFAVLERAPEAKGALLQLHELNRVDATYARSLAHLLGLERWVRLGQDPQRSNPTDPWPLPWTLTRTEPSRLPKDFNLVVIVADALRGDALHSAGYSRNLTPFLDGWAVNEAISFRRAYSQGGGTFAALPFLMAGRSRFSLYGPALHQENLYLSIAQAEGIERFLLVGDGPRHIFSPDLPVIHLGSRGSGKNHRSASAADVFGWTQEAITSFGRDQRFFAYLHLMDVHNDLWKKEDGLDFGDRPRDLYDNNLSYLDRAFQRFVAWLKQAGIYHRTVMLFTADHGEQFWEHGASLHGHTLYEEEIRVPLILLAHGLRVRVEDVPVLAADMAPTLAELAGYSVHPPYDDPHMGISLVPLLLEKERDRYLTRDVVGRASFARRYFQFRNWEWKLVYFAELDVLQLFNVRKDPRELTNFLGEEPEVAAELERELFRYLERVEGKVYRPILFQGRRDG